MGATLETRKRVSNQDMAATRPVEAHDCITHISRGGPFYADLAALTLAILADGDAGEQQPALQAITAQATVSTRSTG